MASEPALHGRAVPLAALRAALADTFDGRGRLAMISGEAGIGKTTLATAIARDAEARGATVVWGRAWEFADAPPYFPVRPCLRALGLEPHADAFQLWEQVLAELARAPAPVVWIVEDLHAADLGTLDLLTFLAQPMRAMRVLVVATARERDPRVTERMLQRLSRMARDGLELRLEPLATEDIAAVGEDTLGRALPAEALRRLVELTGGNPLFVVECARAWRLAGGIDSALGSLPPTVRQVVIDRVGLLPDATGDVLAAAAVLGREFSAATVARMAGSLPARVIDALLPALRSGVVKETRPGQFAFSHMLVRDAIEDALRATEKAALHGRAEIVLASLGDSSEVLVERARHALAAGSAEALGVATRAMELLEKDGAYDRAFELYSRIEASHLLDAADPTTALHAARVARSAGRADDCRRLCDAVIAVARSTSDAEILARAVLLRVADVRPGVIDRSQVALVEEARAALGDRAPGLACRVTARLATALQPAVDLAVPRDLARGALARAHALGDPAVILDVLELAGWGIYDEPLEERLDWANQLRDRALAAADLAKALTALGWLASHRIEAGDFAGFETDIGTMLAIADELGHPRHRWRALLFASTRAFTRGRVADSDRYVTEVEQLAPLTDDPAIALALPLHRMMRALVLRRDDDVRDELAKLAAVVQPVSDARTIEATLRGVCAARLGDPTTARAQLAILRDRRPIAAVMSGRISASDPSIAYLAELVASAGDADECRHARDALARFDSADITGTAFSFTYDGPKARVCGLLDAAIGELASAEAHLRAALALARSRDHVPWLAQIGRELARVVRTAGRDVEARAIDDEADAVARRIAGTLPGAILRVERAGETWRFVRGTSEVVIKDSRGVQLLARLIERPGEDIHVLALASDDGTSAPVSSAGDLLDDRARATYRRRLAELADEVTDAESRGDLRRATSLDREREALVAELARATGMGGRSRAAASTTERARVNVQKRLKDAIGRIAEVDAELGNFLERAVRTGTFCCFRQ